MAPRRGRIVAVESDCSRAGDYVDRISSTEFTTRPGFLRLMNALKPPPFGVLIVSEESRLQREAIETGYALKQSVAAGVRVCFYLEDRERTPDSRTDKIMLSLTAFAVELKREKACQRTYDAIVRKARAGHVSTLMRRHGRHLLLLAWPSVLARRRLYLRRRRSLPMSELQRWLRYDVRRLLFRSIVREPSSRP